MTKNANRWNWNRGEYLREVGWFLGILSLFVYNDGKKKKKNAILLQKNKNSKKKITPKNPKKKKLSNLKQEKRKRYDSPGEKKHRNLSSEAIYYCEILLLNGKLSRV
jgi:hypothetical protein